MNSFPLLANFIWSPCFLFIAKSFSLDISIKTTSWIHDFVRRFFEKKLMVAILSFMTISEYVLSNEISSATTILILMLLTQSLFLNNFSFCSDFFGYQLDTSGKTSWIASICLTVFWEKIDGSYAELYNNINQNVYFLMTPPTTVLILLLHGVTISYLFCKPFLFLFQTFCVIISIFFLSLSVLSLEASVKSHLVSNFLAISFLFGCCEY